MSEKDCVTPDLSDEKCLEIFEKWLKRLEKKHPRNEEIEEQITLVMEEIKQLKNKLAEKASGNNAPSGEGKNA